MTTTYVPLKCAKKAMREVREESLREGERRGYARATEFVRMASTLNGSTHAVLKALQEEGDAALEVRDNFAGDRRGDVSGRDVGGGPGNEQVDLDAVLMAALDALAEAKTHHPETDGGPVYAYLAGLLADPEALAYALAEMDGGEVVGKAVTHAPKGGVSIGGKHFTGGEFIPAEVMANATDEEKAEVGDEPNEKRSGIDNSMSVGDEHRNNLEFVAPELLESVSDWAAEDGDVSQDMMDGDYPKVWYHGTISDGLSGEFRFDKGRHDWGHGVYLTSDPGYAAQYTHDKSAAESAQDLAELQSAGVHPVAARLKNPLIPEKMPLSFFDDFAESIGETPFTEYGYKRTYQAAAEIVDLIRSNTAAFTEYAKGHGYDGIVTELHETGDDSQGSGQKVVVVFSGLDAAPLTDFSPVQRKSFDESKHPRGDNGRFIGREQIHAAKSDPKLADELRAKTTDPEQRKKLEAALKGDVDLGRTKAGEHRERVAKQRQDRQERVKRAQELANDISMWRRGGEAVPSSHFRELAEVLPSMTVAELRSVRGKLAASFGGDRRKAEMAARLLEHAKNKAALLETNEKYDDMDALDFGSLHEYQNEGNAKGNEARNPNPEEQHGGRMQQRHDLMGAGAKGELQAPGKLSHGTPDTGSVLKLGDKPAPPPQAEPSKLVTPDKPGPVPASPGGSGQPSPKRKWTVTPEGMKKIDAAREYGRKVVNRNDYASDRERMERIEEAKAAIDLAEAEAQYEYTHGKPMSDDLKEMILDGRKLPAQQADPKQPEMSAAHAKQVDKLRKRGMDIRPTNLDDYEPDDSEPAPESKTPNEMTLAEYVAQNKGDEDFARARHRAVVQTHLEDGGTVEPEVLKDYPDIAAKYGGEGATVAAHTTKPTYTTDKPEGGATVEQPSGTPLSPAVHDAVKSAVKHHKRMQMPGKPVPQMVVYHIPEHRNTGGQLIEPAKVNAVPVDSYTGQELLSGKLPHLKIEGTFEVGADGVPKRVEPTQRKAFSTDWDDLRAELAVKRGIVHDDGATGV